MTVQHCGKTEASLMETEQLYLMWFMRFETNLILLRWLYHLWWICFLFSMKIVIWSFEWEHCFQKQSNISFLIIDKLSLSINRYSPSLIRIGTNQVVVLVTEVILTVSISDLPMYLFSDMNSIFVSFVVCGWYNWIYLSFNF